MQTCKHEKSERVYRQSYDGERTWYEVRKCLVCFDRYRVVETKGTRERVEK